MDNVFVRCPVRHLQGPNARHKTAALRNYSLFIVHYQLALTSFYYLRRNLTSP